VEHNEMHRIYPRSVRPRDDLFHRSVHGPGDGAGDQCYWQTPTAGDRNISGAPLSLPERRADMARHRWRQHRLALAGPSRDRVTAQLTLGRSAVAFWADPADVAVRRNVRPHARACPTSPGGQPSSTSEPRPATGRPTRSLGKPNARRCCG